MTTAISVVDELREHLGADAILGFEEGPHMPCVMVVPDAIRDALVWLRDESSVGYDFLSDLAGADGMRLNWDNWPGRFHVVYHLRSTSCGSRIRVKVPVGESSPEVPSIHDLWRSADWMEREVYDMYGVAFSGHPNLKRILCHHKFKGHALRKDYFIQDGQPLDDAEDLLDELGEWGESPDDDGFSELIPVNIGPAHPATHGTLRILAKLDGETIVKAVPEIGYLHRGFEKHCEESTYTMAIPYTDRLNYCSAMLNNVAWCHTVETMIGVELPERTQVIRVIVSELSRIIDHCVCLGAVLVDLGALTNFWYLFNLRERIYTVLEALCGARLTSTYLRIGGVSEDLNDEFVSDVRAILRDMPNNINDVLGLIAKNRIFLDRTQGVGVISAEDAASFSWTGPCARASGIRTDLRRDDPYLIYGDLKFDVPIRSEGDTHARVMIRFDEMLQSMRIIEQCLDRLKPGPVMSDDKRIVMPEKDSVYGSIEGLMNHFVLVYEGLRVPDGEHYAAIEAANGELGFYIIADGTGRPQRVRCRPPCFTLHSAFATMIEGGMIADAVPTLGSLNVIAGELDR